VIVRDLDRDNSFCSVFSLVRDMLSMSSSSRHISKETRNAEFGAPPTLSADRDSQSGRYPTTSWIDEDGVCWRWTSSLQAHDTFQGDSRAYRRASGLVRDGDLGWSFPTTPIRAFRSFQSVSESNPSDEGDVE
jgi:hypothetical protein